MGSRGFIGSLFGVLVEPRNVQKVVILYVVSIRPSVWLAGFRAWLPSKVLTKWLQILIVQHRRWIMSKHRFWYLPINLKKFPMELYLAYLSLISNRWWCEIIVSFTRLHFFTYFYTHPKTFLNFVEPLRLEVPSGEQRSSITWEALF